jgi:Flp pilus assembly protein TadB
VNGPGATVLRLVALFAGILLVVFGPDTALGLAGLAAGLVLVVASLLWWLRSEASRR